MKRGPGRCLAVLGMGARRGRSIRVVEQGGGIGAAGQEHPSCEAGRGHWRGGAGASELRSRAGALARRGRAGAFAWWGHGRGGAGVWAGASAGRGHEHGRVAGRGQARGVVARPDRPRTRGSLRITGGHGHVRIGQRTPLHSRNQRLELIRDQPSLAGIESSHVLQLSLKPTDL